MPRGKRLTVEERNLDEKHLRSMEYINGLIVQLQLRLRGKSRLNISDVVRMMNEKLGVELSDTTVGGWTTGKAIPTPESCDMIAKFFEVDPGEVYAACSRPYTPPMTIEEVQRQTIAAIEEWKRGERPNEDWSDGDWILAMLRRYDDPKWIKRLRTGLQPSVDIALKADLPLFDRARHLAHLMGIQMFYYRLVHGDMFDLSWLEVDGIPVPDWMIPPEKEPEDEDE